MADYNDYDNEDNKLKKKLSYGTPENQEKYKKLQQGINRYSANPEWIERIKKFFSPSNPTKPKDEQEE